MSEQYLRGVLGYKGERGYSAYEIACKNGFIGTEKEWLSQLGTSKTFEQKKEVFTSTANQTTFDISNIYIFKDFVDVYVNGFKLNANEYEVNTETRQVTLVGLTLEEGQTVEIITTTTSSSELPIVTNLTASANDETVPSAKAVLDNLPVNVKHFGAKGDGVTDDTEAIQEAINSNSPVINIPMGIYLVEGLIIPSNKIIVGTGSSSIIKQKADTTLYKHPIEINGASNIIVEKIVIDGNSENQTVDSSKHGVYLLECDNITIRDCIIQNHNGEGIMIGYTNHVSQNILIDNCIIQNNIRNEMAITNCDNVKVTNCVFNGGKDTSALLDVEIQADNDSTKNVSFSNCEFIQNEGEAIKLLTNGYETEFTPIIFDSCIVKSVFNIANYKNVNIDKSIFTEGLQLSNVSDITINSSNISKNEGNGVFVYGDNGNYCENVKIINCDITNSNIGVAIQNTNNFYLTGSVIKDNDVGVGVYYNNNYSLFNSCFICNNETGIKYVGGSYTNNYIDNCILNNTTNYEGMINSQSIVNGFKNTMKMVNDTYAIDISLDENANIVIPTSVYTNMIGIKKQTDDSTSWVQNGMIFEDVDGYLKYKNLSGTVQQISN